MRPLLATALLFVCGANVAAAPRVSFELVTEGGFPVGGQRKWINVLKDLDQTGIRIRAGRPGDKVEVTNLGTEASPSYHVVGILTSNNRLEVVGGRFSLNDRAKIAQWIKKLQQEGVDAFTGARAAFGLKPEELVAFHDALAKPIAFDTKDVRAGDVARKLVRGLPMQVTVSAEARRAFARDEAVLDELNGLSTGTALAATLRPLGLVMLPRKPPGGKVLLLICDVRQAEESWPVGWPPEASPRKAAPDLYEYLPVEIADIPLSEAIAAIDGRVKTPFLFDHNGMARLQIDPAAKNVNFPRKRVQYRRVLDQVLFQGGLKSEVRLDEAGGPFLWISPRARRD